MKELSYVKNILSNQNITNDKGIKNNEKTEAILIKEVNNYLPLKRKEDLMTLEEALKDDSFKERLV